MFLLKYMGQSRSAVAILLAGILALLLSSCGGGSSGGSSSGSLPNSSTNTLATTESINGVVAIDPAIPNATRSKIQQIISPFGSSALGAPVAVPSAKAGGDTIIMAIDSENSILLAAITNSASTTLTVVSTAEALTRLAFGSLPELLTPAKFQKAVQETAAYPQLVAAIQEAVNSGQPASQSAVVQDKLRVVLNQAIPTFRAAMSPGISASVMKAGIVKAPGDSSSSLSPIPEVKAPFPFRVVPSGPYSVYIQGGSVDFVNTMQISWGAISDQAPTTEVLLPGASVAKSFAYSASSILGPDRVNIPGNKGLGFFLTVKQTENSKTDNILASVQDAARTVISLSVAGSLVQESCVLSLASAILSAAEARTFAKDSSADTFLSYFKAVTVSQEEMRGVVDQCFVDPIARQNAAATAGLFTRSLAKFLSFYAAFGTANDLATLSYRLTQMVFYWDKTYTLKICEQAGTGDVVSCVAKMTLEPANIAMIEGATFQPLLRGFTADSKKTETPLPSGLLYEPLSLDGPVSLFGKEYQTTVFANKLGTGFIRVTDPFTKTVSDPYTIDVVTPNFDPNPLRIQVGSFGNMQLKGPAGKSLITENNGAETFNGGALLANLTLTPFSIASTQATILNLFFNSIITVRGIAMGNATLSIKNTYTGKPITGSVLVEGAPLQCSPLSATPCVMTVHDSGDVVGWVGDYLFATGGGPDWIVLNLSIVESYSDFAPFNTGTCPVLFTSTRPFTSEDGVIGRSLTGWTPHFPKVDYEYMLYRPPFLPANSMMLGRVGTSSLGDCGAFKFDVKYTVTFQNVKNPAQLLVLQR